MKIHLSVWKILRSNSLRAAKGVNRKQSPQCRAWWWWWIKLIVLNGTVLRRWQHLPPAVPALLFHRQMGWRCDRWNGDLKLLMVVENLSNTQDQDPRSPGWNPPVPSPPSTHLEEVACRVEIIKAGKFPKQKISGDYLIYPTSFSQNPAATKAGCDSEQVSHCKFLFPVPFPVASASNRALGLMQICMKKMHNTSPNT